MTGSGDVTAVVGVDRVPKAVRAAAAVEDADYADLFTARVSNESELSPEAWARLILEQTPTGRAAPLVWRLLGLRLGPMPSTDHVQGWRIGWRGDDYVRLETVSWMMTASAVVCMRDGIVELGLFLRYDQPIARLVWVPVSLVHQRAVPLMLRQALRVGRQR